MILKEFIDVHVGIKKRAMNVYPGDGDYMLKVFDN